VDYFSRTTLDPNVAGKTTVHSRAKKMTAELNAIIDDDWQWRMENLPEFATGTLYFICVTLLHALS
jgi:hypothetical protein